MRYGRTVEDGFLPVYSCDTEEEARQLLVVACSTNMEGEFIARELATDQSLEHLQAFSDRLALVDEMMKNR